MKFPRSEVPAGQTWSCHGCTDCCRDQFLVTLSPAEKQRLEQQGWTAADGVNPAEMIVPEGSRFRLSHQINGACVFLDSSGRCRIHAKFGEAAKPLACRLYPLVIHPAGKKLVVGLRFSCPSAVANQGQPLAEQSGEVQQLVRLVVPDDYKESRPPPVLAGSAGEWPDFLRFVARLDASLTATNVPMALKLLRALHWLGAVEKGSLDQITGPGAEEILDALVVSATKKLPTPPEKAEKPSRFGRFFLRLMVLEHARLITVQEMNAPGHYRWKMLAAIWQFSRPGGHTPALRSGLARVKFTAIEKHFGPLSPEMEAMLTRYFRVKVQSLHFCGHAFHDRSLIEGFRSLTLLYPMIVWLSRWLAVSDQRNMLANADVGRAISMVDDHYSYSPYFSWRVRLLQQRNDIARLCGWYGC